MFCGSFLENHKTTVHVCFLIDLADFSLSLNNKSYVTDFPNPDVWI